MIQWEGSEQLADMERVVWIRWISITLLALYDLSLLVYHVLQRFLKAVSTRDDEFVYHVRVFLKSRCFVFLPG